jgi:hypothetical protein
MVNDALWSDINNDNLTDLIVVGEWMPITIFINDKDRLINMTSTYGLEEYKGWWNSICGGDFDNDGDTDYIAGNLGLNSIFKAAEEEPVRAYHADFDNNGRYDVILTTYYPDQKGGKKEFPIHFRSDLFRQMDGIKNRFDDYESYSKATIDSILSEEEINIANIATGTWFQSIYLENTGNTEFIIKSLPNEAQFAPIYGMQPGDFNEDTFLDLLIVGNEYGNNAFWGRCDALNGLLLEGKGDGTFLPLNYTETGFFVPGNAKSLVSLPVGLNRILMVASQNQDSVRVFEFSPHVPTRAMEDIVSHAIIRLRNGKYRKQEFYHGQGYYSQSTRYLSLPDSAISYQIFDIKGNEIEKSDIQD